MTRNPALLVLLVTLGAGAVPAAADELPVAEQYHIRGEYAWWWPKLGSEISKGEDGTLTNVTDELGIGDDKTWAVRATLRAGASHKLYGTYTQLDYLGDVTDHSTVRYGGQTFFRGTRLVTSMKGDYYGGQYEWDFVKGGKGFVGAVLGARVLDLDVVLAAPEEARREQEKVTAVRPVVGVAARGYLGRRVSIEGMFAGLSIGSRGYAIEFEASAQIHLFDRVAIKGGYRSFKVKDDNGSTFIEFRNEGGIVGVELSL
jgi:hypothetical protein